MVKLIDVYLSKRTGKLVVIDRPEHAAKFMLSTKRYTGGERGRYAPFEERDKWFEVIDEKKKEIEKTVAEIKQVEVSGKATGKSSAGSGDQPTDEPKPAKKTTRKRSTTKKSTTKKSK